MVSESGYFHFQSVAVHHQAGGACFTDVLQLLVQQLGRDFREFHGIRAAEAAADFFLLAGHVLGRVRDEFTRGLLDAQAPAEVAGGVVGDPFAGIGEVLGLEAQAVAHEGAEVDNLVRENLGLGQDIRLILQDFRIGVLQMRPLYQRNTRCEILKSNA